MVGVVVVTHGRLADELVKTAEGIVGSIQGIRCLCINPHAGSDDTRRQIKQAIQEVDGGAGVLILTDMFGGTPSNLSLSFLESDSVEVLTGVNLPMLLKLASPNRKNEPLKELAESLENAGRGSITLAGRILNNAIK